MQRHLKKEGFLELEVRINEEARYYCTGPLPSLKEGKRDFREFKKSLTQTYGEELQGLQISIRFGNYVEKPQRISSAPIEVKHEVHRKLLQGSFHAFNRLERSFAAG